MGLFGRKKESKSVAELGGDGTYSYSDVVGESFHRTELLELIAKAPATEQQSGEVFVTALLVADRTNEYDSNAIAVMVDGKLVGYIARDETQGIHDAIRTVAEMGYSPDGFYCKAVIGWSGDVQSAPIGVRLDLLFQDG